MYRTLIIITLLNLSSVNAWYYGRTSTEANLVFYSKADVALNIPLDTSLKRLNAKNGQYRKKALDLVDQQIMHLMGIFQSDSFLNSYWPGALGETYKITFTQLKKGRTPSRRELHYKFEGKVVFHKNAFGRFFESEVPLILPLQPDKIYKLGMIDGHNYCTDEHYNTEIDFWYFWDPDKNGCPLNDNNTDVLRFTGTLNRLSNTRWTYPEYDQLYKRDNNKKELNISVFVGLMNEDLDFSLPDRKDEAYKAYNQIQREVRALGYKLSENKKNFSYDIQNEQFQDGINNMKVYSKELKTKLGTPLKVNIRILITDTSITSPDETFHHYYVNSLQTADIMVYDGHSGLGGNLDLMSLPDVDWNLSKYQLFYFNGCSSYPYFNGSYFSAKNGTKKLDIITSGLPTYSNTAGSNVMAFLNNFLKGKINTYQSILGDIELSNQVNGEETYLTGVNGDEDNIFSPE